MHVDAIPLRLMIGGFRVIAVDERDEMVEVVIETLSPEACCPHCGHADAAAKERKQLVVRDVPLRPSRRGSSGGSDGSLACGAARPSPRPAARSQRAPRTRAASMTTCRPGRSRHPTRRWPRRKV